MSEWSRYKSERRRNAFVDNVTRVNGKKSKIWMIVDALFVGQTGGMRWQKAKKIPRDSR